MKKMKNVCFPCFSLSLSLFIALDLCVCVFLAQSSLSRALSLFSYEAAHEKRINDGMDKVNKKKTKNQPRPVSCLSLFCSLLFLSSPSFLCLSLSLYSLSPKIITKAKNTAHSLSLHIACASAIAVLAAAAIAASLAFGR